MTVQRSKTPYLRGPYERCASCPIREQAVCSYATPEELALLDEAKFYRDYQAGQEIVGEGERTAIVGAIVSGVVALNKTLEDGRRQMVGLLFASAFIGRPLRPIAPYDAIAITPVRMCLFHREPFEEILRSSINLGHRLLEVTLDELDVARDWMLNLGRKSAQEKVASFLLIISRRSAALANQPLANGLSVEIPLTRETMGDLLGLTLETVSRQFTALRRRGVIDLPNRQSMQVTDLATLRLLAGDHDGSSTPNRATA